MFGPSLHSRELAMLADVSISFFYLDSDTSSTKVIMNIIKITSNSHHYSQKEIKMVKLTRATSLLVVGLMSSSVRAFSPSQAVFARRGVAMKAGK